MDKLTPDNTNTQPVNTEVPNQPQQSPFAQAAPAVPAAPIQPDPNVAPAAPTVPQAPVIPQAPVQPVTATVDPTAQPVVPQQPAPTVPQAPVEQPAAPAQPGGINTTQSMQPQAQQVPNQPAFIPPTLMPQRVANPGQEYYKEDPDHKAHAMKKVLDAQPRAWTYVPLQSGEKPTSMLPVGINGYFVYVRKGIMVEVPFQIAQMIAESFNLDAINGAELDLSKNEDKQRALT